VEVVSRGTSDAKDVYPMPETLVEGIFKELAFAMEMRSGSFPVFCWII
jgi:hypothetical protein